MSWIEVSCHSAQLTEFEALLGPGGPSDAAWRCRRARAHSVQGVSRGASSRAAFVGRAAGFAGGQVVEDPFDGIAIGDLRDDPQASAASWAAQRIEGQGSAHQLGPVERAEVAISSPPRRRSSWRAEITWNPETAAASWLSGALLLSAVPDGADELEQSLDCAPFADREQAEMHHQWQQQLASWRDEAEQRCEVRIPERAPPPAELADLVTAPEDLPADAVALDRIIVHLAERLLRRDLELGDGLRRLCDGNGWRRLGYASLGQYARERLGVSLSSVNGRMAVSRRALKLAPLREAVEQGVVGFEAAMLVGRVATESSVKAWLDRAEERTIKHLGEEVAVAEIIARTTGKGAPPPLDAKAVAAMMALESHVLSGRAFRTDGEPRSGQISVTPDSDVSPPRRGAGTVTLRWRVTQDAEMRRAIRVAHQWSISARAGNDGPDERQSLLGLGGGLVPRDDPPDQGRGEDQAADHEQHE